MSSRKKFIATAPVDRYRKPFCRWAKLDNNDFVVSEDDTPIEDYGMFLILNEEVTSEEANNIFMALMGAQEGEEPELGPPHENFWVGLHSPHRLSEKEMRIYQELTS